MKLLYEKTYGDYLKLEGTTEHFADYLAGELNCNLKNHKDKYNWIKNTHSGTWEFENGLAVEVETYFDDEKKEWVCKAYEIERGFDIQCKKCGCKEVNVVNTIYNEVKLKCQNKECKNEEVIAYT
jgi:hypothetical protein